MPSAAHVHCEFRWPACQDYCSVASASGSVQQHSITLVTAGERHAPCELSQGWGVRGGYRSQIYCCNGIKAEQGAQVATLCQRRGRLWELAKLDGGTEDAGPL